MDITLFNLPQRKLRPNLSYQITMEQSSGMIGFKQAAKNTIQVVLLAVLRPGTSPVHWPTGRRKAPKTMSRTAFLVCSLILQSEEWWMLLLTTKHLRQQMLRVKQERNS